jgi:hypothetical protein
MNWKHSFYEIYALSIGQAFTIDEAHRTLSEFKEDRLFSIASALSENKRAQAKTIDSLRSVEDYKKGNESKSNLRRAEAYLGENKARIIIAQPCFDMARAEVAFIDRCLGYIEPFRLYATPSGYQHVQSLELAFEYVLTGALGLDYQTLRNIYVNPYSNAIFTIIQSVQGTQDILDVPKLSNAFASFLDLPLKHTCQHHIPRASKFLLDHVAVDKILEDYISSASSTMLSLSELEPTKALL